MCDSDCRRTFLKTSGAATLGLFGFGAISTATAADTPRPAVLTKEQRDAMTPDQVLESFKRGNKRFRESNPRQRDLIIQRQAVSKGQYPMAVLLSCIDSRAPAEAVLDRGLGDVFNTRMAGNVLNEDVLGGMEFCTALMGAKVVLVMGHTSCGAVRGAIDDAKLGNLTTLLAKIRPAIAQTTYTGDRSGANYGFVDAVARKYVELTVAQIREKSPVMADLEKQGKIKIVGSMYNLATGGVDWL